jgi:DNA-binding LacI/PurR family transcriptional regulator
VLFLTTWLREDYSSVAFDNYNGGEIGPQHLLSRGFRRIAHLSGPLDWWELRQLMQGWANVL